MMVGEFVATLLYRIVGWRCRCDGNVSHAFESNLKRISIEFNRLVSRFLSTLT